MKSRMGWIALAAGLLAASAAPAFADEPKSEQAPAPEVREPSDVQTRQIADPNRGAGREVLVRDHDDPLFMVPHPAESSRTPGTRSRTER